MTLWNETVKKTFEQGRLTNPTYQFKDALKDAKKFYNKDHIGCTIRQQILQMRFHHVFVQDKRQGAS